MKALNIEEVKELLEGRGYFGFRGLSGIYGQKEYSEGAELEFSIDDWEERGVQYNPKLPLLTGTSAIGVNEYMEDEEITEMYNKALRYSDCNKVLLINGTNQEYGADNDEVALSNDGCGAISLGYVML